MPTPRITVFFQTNIPIWAIAVLSCLLGIGVGYFLLHWIIRLTQEDEPAPEEGKVWKVFLTSGTGLLFAAFALALLGWECQRTPMVRPSPFWWFGRLVYHLILIGLLVAATGTDLRAYTIPDQITVPGIAIGLLGAVVSGDLQMMHLWIDWSYEIPNYRPPYFPQWLADYPHWHGLAWSAAGLAAGAGITAAIRRVAKALLGQESLGSGDVMLMAMIGSFIGWQPVLFVFGLAPLIGLLLAVLLRIVSGRVIVPFGASLSAATLVVLFSWRWIWMAEIPWSSESTLALRRFFGDAIGLAIFGGATLVIFAGLLFLLRLYRSIPVR